MPLPFFTPDRAIASYILALGVSLYVYAVCPLSSFGAHLHLLRTRVSGILAARDYVFRRSGTPPNIGWTFLRFISERLKEESSVFTSRSVAVYRNHPICCIQKDQYRKRVGLSHPALPASRAVLRPIPKKGGWGSPTQRCSRAVRTAL